MSSFDLSGYRKFATREDVASLVAQSERQTGSRLPRTLLIFSTSKQHTWLVATARSLVCVLDDVRKEVPRIQWSMPIEETRGAPIRAGSYSDRRGLLDIG